MNPPDAGPTRGDGSASGGSGGDEGAKIIVLRPRSRRAEREAARLSGPQPPPPPRREAGAHRAESPPEPDEPARPRSADERLADFLGFVRRRLTGDYTVDDFGFDPELTERVLLPAARLAYERWFSIELRGLENIPMDGGALVVANHSGVLPFDAVMLQVAVHDYAERWLRLLVADIVYEMPVLSHLVRKGGHTLAAPADAARLLADGELVGVFPEGYKGIGKPFRDRYRLQRFGRGGFATAAIRAHAPIVPCAIVGAEEIYPKIGDLRPLARLLGVPYFPITPIFPLLGPLGAIPLPTRWIIEFGAPIDTADFDRASADDPVAVFNLTNEVRDTIQQQLSRLVVERGSVFRRDPG
ncbi:lysophospholipid acyltransferase family protein [Allonocardiopsis opalescens]|uniref:1-acyl-sn-glycerol-3-phosphate acyltransferase n=1 Tax=Allonocardiopsis opalescens TaxID=1144618 RepID=A0A2T0Q7S4_9ACTN|nr:lysophospholipid acyltransferase family protein [Allonocardiopsis opalescens]PRX99875.1 1-acyl-sn-glycerol-3-phosphate acyltransferase [Allonocardiopsis opalescens]